MYPGTSDHGGTAKAHAGIEQEGETSGGGHGRIRVAAAAAAHACGFPAFNSCFNCVLLVLLRHIFCYSVRLSYYNIRVV